jgi:hypothetical protein
MHKLLRASLRKLLVFIIGICIHTLVIYPPATPGGDQAWDSSKQVSDSVSQNQSKTKRKAVPLSLSVSLCLFLLLVGLSCAHLGPFGGHLGTILAYRDIILLHAGHLGTILAISDHIEAISGTMLGQFRAMLNSLGPVRTHVYPWSKNSILIFEP